MLVTLAVIGATGMLLERQVFARIETWTVVRWGMVTPAQTLSTSGNSEA